MNTYKIVKLYTTNQHMFRTKSYGYVDVRTEEAETESENLASKQSLDSLFDNKLNKNHIIRLVTISNNKSLKDAIDNAEILFEETIDLLNQLPMAEFESCNGAGYFLNLEKNSITPFFKQESINERPLNLFHMTRLYEPINAEQYIAAGRKDELVKAYLRSLNWYNRSKDQKRLYLKFLYSWISLETLSKVNDEIIIPKLCLVIGFPLKNDCNSFNKNILSKLSSIKNYRIWKKYIFKNLDQARVLRNDIVHSGFKEKDIDSKSLMLKIKIIDMIHPRLINYMANIIVQPEMKLEEAWNMMSKNVANNTMLIQDTTNLINKLEEN